MSQKGFLIWKDFSAYERSKIMRKAANILKEKIKFELNIVGRGVNKNMMDSYIVKNDLKKFVKNTVTKRPLSSGIKQADLFVLTSKFEGLPNVLLESLTLKKFVISSNCPTGPREILDNGKNGLLFKIGDYKDLSQKIIYYNSNRLKLKKMINMGYKRLNRFDLKNNLQKYFVILDTKSLKLTSVALSIALGKFMSVGFTPPPKVTSAVVHIERLEKPRFEADAKVKQKDKNIFKTLTRKSLDKAQALNFLSEYVIVIDEKNGEGTITYFFDDIVYKKYKNFDLISINNWTISRTGTLTLFDANNNKTFWKIQPSNKDTINIKRSLFL